MADTSVENSPLFLPSSELLSTDSPTDLFGEFLPYVSTLLVSYNNGYPYPMAAIPKLHLRTQVIDKDYEPVVDYGYPPPPKPVEPTYDLSPLCSPCPSPGACEDDDGNLKDLEDEDDEAYPAAAVIRMDEDSSENSPPLQPPPTPPEFPFSTALEPPPTPPEFPWPTPAALKCSLPKILKGSGMEYMKNLPQELLKLCQPLFCKLCIQNLPSQIISERHYKSRRHKLNINEWLEEHDYGDLRVTVQPVGKDPNFKLKLLKLSEEMKDFGWKENDQEFNFSTTGIPQELRNMFEPLMCKLCHVKHFSRTHAMDHYKSRDHYFRIRVYLGLVSLTPNPKPKAKKNHTYWNYMKKHQLGTFKAKVVRVGLGNSTDNQQIGGHGSSLIRF